MNPYQRIYEVGLLDDLHNFFPDLLYSNRELSPEFQYIRDQTRRLFPNSYARAHLEHRVGTSVFSDLLLMIQPVSIPNRWRNLLAYVQDIEDAEDIELIRDAPMTPVVVRPTIDQINTATSITPHMEVDVSHICTICQDHGSAEETPEWREIDKCEHLYHKKCIDRWFETSVQCPICRVDIRD